MNKEALQSVIRPAACEGRTPSLGVEDSRATHRRR